MALTDRLASTPAKISGKPCSVQALIDKLDGTERDALNNMLYVLGWSQDRIYHAVTDEGHSIGYQTINRHRSRSCRCYVQAKS